MTKRARRKGILYTTLKRARRVDSSVRDFNVHSLIQVSNLNKIGNMIVFADSGIERRCVRGRPSSAFWQYPQRSLIAYTALG